MSKVKLANNNELEILLKELQGNEETELSYEGETTPSSFPCIAVHFYTEDVDFGNVYNIEFIYLSDFN